MWRPVVCGPHAASATLPWTDPAFAFNTSCCGCHMSQLETNYDAALNSYRTNFAATGINCQACHGPCRCDLHLGHAAGDRFDLCQVAQRLSTNRPLTA